MLNRWIEDDGLLDTLDELGTGSIVFSPLAQGLLTDKYLTGVPDDSRASRSATLKDAHLSPENLAHVRASTRSPGSVVRAWRRWPLPGC